MSETSDPSIPTSSSTPASGTGSSGAPGTPGRDPAMPPDLEAGKSLADATPTSLTGDATTGDGGEDDGSTSRDKNTIGNIR